MEANTTNCEVFKMGRRRYEGYKFPHSKTPDKQKADINIPSCVEKRILNKLILLYGERSAKKTLYELLNICKAYCAYKTDDMIRVEKTFDPKNRFTEEDVILITYGDLIYEEGEPPLTTLSTFFGKRKETTINTIHILPFFPYSSDRGFSVIDFKTVDPKLGSWENIEDLESRYKLMFDGVINHVSSQSEWFQEFLLGNPYFENFFISYNSMDDLPAYERGIIFRPRTSDILTKFETAKGDRYVWTTFSEDQIDLNYKEPQVLLNVIEALLFYVRKGADIIRLDAVTYLWANPGTTCANLEQTHVIVRLLNDVLELVAPHVAILTESNIPHNDNLTYFGAGSDEAHMIYNFALPPLTLYAFYKQDATQLSEWAATLDNVSDTTTFFNFLDSHDGIGFMSVKDILPKEEIDFIIQNATERGGLISYKLDKDGVNSPYEINITWFSALNRDDGSESVDFQVKRFIASRAVALVIQGVPGIYIHSFFGTKNDKDAVIKTESNREINRAIINYESLLNELNDPDTLTSKISRKLYDLIAIRTRQPAFHPNACQHILYISPRIFAVLRMIPADDDRILSLINISDKIENAVISLKMLKTDKKEWRDIISKRKFKFENENLEIKLEPYDVLWLKGKQ